MASVISKVPVGGDIKLDPLERRRTEASRRMTGARPSGEGRGAGPGTGRRPGSALRSGMGKGVSVVVVFQSIIEDSRPWRSDGRRFPSDAILLLPSRAGVLAGFGPAAGRAPGGDRCRARTASATRREVR